MSREYKGDVFDIYRSYDLPRYVVDIFIHRCLSDLRISVRILGNYRHLYYTDETGSGGLTGELWSKLRNLLIDIIESELCEVEKLLL